MGTQRLSGYAQISCSPPFGAFEGTDGDGDANVYKACLGDTAGFATMITSFNNGGLTAEGIHNPVVSPSGSRILFEVANPSTGFTEIWVVTNAAGSTATQVLADPTDYYMMPSWHPDGDQFVCVHGASGSLLGSIETSSVSDPGTISTLKTADGSNSPFRPAFNFDGTRVAYLWDANIGAGGHLRVMDDDGTNDAAVDTAVRYRFQGPQFAWAHSSNVIAYDDGNTGGTDNAYVINDDGTGQVQINANGVAAGLKVWVSDRAWPPDDSYVVYACSLATGSYQNAVRAELDGSTTTSLNNTNGSWLQDNFRQVLVADGRVWFIESAQVLGSFALDGSDYLSYLTIDGAAMDDLSNGDGWFFN